LLRKALTLDQIRLFVCVAEEGSFSAAARSLARAQSAVSYGVAKLEALLGVRLFERSGHRPALTEIGHGLLSDAREILDAVGKLDTHAGSLAEGMESGVRIAVDAISPAELLIEFGRAFQERFPDVSLQIQTDVLGAVPALVLDGTCQIGIAGPIGVEARGLERRFLTHIPMVPVAAVGHPLAGVSSPIASAQVRRHVHIVISPRVEVSTSWDHSGPSGTMWRVADAATKLALIRAGLAWGQLPLDMVRDDLDRGVLARLVLEEWGPDPLLAPLSSITRRDAPPGPAGQWLLGQLESICRRISGTEH